MLRLALIAGALAACSGLPWVPRPAPDPRTETAGTVPTRNDPPPLEPDPYAGLAAVGLACPIGEPGTRITVEDTDDGAAMAFVTSGDTDALRAQVFAMAELHNQIFAALRAPIEQPGPTSRRDDEEIHASGPGPRPSPRVAPMNDERDLVVLVPSAARVENIDGGARLVFSTDASELAALRAEVRGEAEAIEDACAWPE